MFEVGQNVQLRSGGSHMTVSDAHGNSITVTYQNPVSGKIEKEVIAAGALRASTDRPVAPEDQAQLRSTPATSSFTPATSSFTSKAK